MLARGCGIVAAGCALAALVAPAVSAQVYRCTEGGKTVYSDKPCGSSSKSVNVQSNTIQSPSQTEKLEHESRLGRIAVGMAPSQVQRAWGPPTKVNTTNSQRGVSEQWVYRKGDDDAYVYLENGKVTSWTTHKSTPGSSTPSAPRPMTVADREAIERADKARERRHITGNVRMSREQVRDKIGEPDEKVFSGGIEHWVYLPTATDAQTRTVYRFTYDGVLFDVERVIQR